MLKDHVLKRNVFVSNVLWIYRRRLHGRELMGYGGVGCFFFFFSNVYVFFSTFEFRVVCCSDCPSIFNVRP